MKEISSLPGDLTKLKKRIIKNLIKAQEETAQRMKEDAVQIISTHGTGAYSKTIQVSKTKINSSKIQTKIFTNYTVQAKSNGNVYNLGMLLENGTLNHAIPNAFNWGVIYGYDSYMYKRTLSKDWHPGSVAVPHFRPALNKNKTEYKNLIRKAIKESING